MVTPLMSRTISIITRAIRFVSFWSDSKSNVERSASASPTWQCSHRTPSAVVNPRMMALSRAPRTESGSTLRFLGFSGHRNP